MQKIIISRTDNIGDVVLTLPITAYLKNLLPNCRILFLARHYVQSVVECCPYVDRFVSWDELDSLSESQAVDRLKQLSADTVLHVFPHKKIAALAKKARIPNRIGTSHRFYHLLGCNKKVNFTRAKSDLHEAQLNFKLLTPLGFHFTPTLTELSELDYLKVETTSKKVRQLIDPARYNLLLHPLSNGHGREWPLKHFIQLVRQLNPEHYNVLVTGSTAERKQLEQTDLAKLPQVMRACGKLNLRELLQLIQASNGLVASSTGPLHLAAALGVHTLGLFAPAPNISPTRWGPLGKRAQSLVINKDCTGKQCSSSACPCLQAISVHQVIKIIDQQKKRSPNPVIHVTN